jgi:dsDNA-binding SOS-regulon protein
LKIETKKKFDVNMHCLSKGFTALHVPASKIANEYFDQLKQAPNPMRSETHEALSLTLTPKKEHHSLTQEAAGARIPKAFKKT